MATMNISLPESMREWVESKTSSGLYANNSDYVRDLIRRDQLREQRLASLQAAITTGLNSGVDEEFSIEKLQREMDAE